MLLSCYWPCNFEIKQLSDKHNDRQVHWVERLMPFAQYMSILYLTRSINKADGVLRHPDFFHPGDVHLRRTLEMVALRWDEYVPNLWYQSNNTAFLVLSADIVSVVDGFMTKLKTTYSSCSYISDERTRWKGHGLIKSFDGLYTYHDMLAIPRPAQDMRILMLTKYHDNVGHSYWRRISATLCFCERMSFDCKSHYSNCTIVCNRAKPSRHGYLSFSPLSVPHYLW